MFRFWRRAHGTRKRDAHQDSTASSGYLFTGNDLSEIERLNLQHFMFRREFFDQRQTLHGGDFSSPIRNPVAILDVACGTGFWAIEMARRFPNAQVKGFDIQPPTANQEQRPENCQLFQGDALATFAFPTASFDLVMARANSAYVPRDRWPGLIVEMARVTRPGGWVEIRDFGVVRSESPALQQLTELFVSLAEQLGIYPGSGPYLAQWLTQAGLRGVKAEQRQVICSPQHGSAGSPGGRLMLTDYLALLERVRSRIVAQHLASAEQWADLLETAKRDSGMTQPPSPILYPSSVILTSAFGQR